MHEGRVRKRHMGCTLVTLNIETHTKKARELTAVRVREIECERVEGACAVDFDSAQLRCGDVAQHTVTDVSRGRHTETAR